jgi:hypothetical protein
MNLVKMTPKEINQWNEEFWVGQQALLEKRMADPGLRETALEAMAAESTKGVPLYYQKSIYEALADAERVRQRFISQHARKGGHAKKTDVLQTVIEQIVQRNLAISLPELIAKLREQQGFEPIQDFTNGTIWFTNHHDRTKEAKLSGLKDRLSRAKKKFRSR